MTDLQNIYKQLDTIYERMHHDDPGIDQVYDAMKNIEDAMGEINAFDPEEHAFAIRERELEQYNDARGS